MCVHGINVNLSKMIKLNILKKLDDQIEPKNNKENRMNQTNKLEV